MSTVLPATCGSAAVAIVGAMSEVPLRRNRDFVLLQSGQLLSSAGSASSAIAYPLLVLAFTHSPSKAGIVGFADFLPAALFGLFAGVAADRWNRKRVMIVADVVQAVAIGGLAAAILADTLSLWLVAGVAFIEGTAGSFFSIASNGAMRAVVPPPQMPTAAGALQARQATVRLAGPPLGGALFGIARALPFIADLVSYLFSIGTLLAMRTPSRRSANLMLRPSAHRSRRGSASSGSTRSCAPLR
jgi:MFS family permease